MLCRLAPGAALAGVCFLAASRAEAQQPRPAVAETQPSKADQLTGRLLTPRGEAVANARIELRRYLLRTTNALDLVHKRIAQQVIQVRSDKGGRFRAVLPRGLPFELHVATAKWAREIRSAVHAGETLEIKLRKPAFIEGIVLHADTRQPIANARVRAWATRTRVEVLRGTTNEAGHFRFGKLMPEAISLEVLPMDAQPPSWRRLELIGGRTLRCDVTAPAGAMLSGVITDTRTGKPIAGAEIADSWTFRRCVQTDAEGRYELRGRKYDELYVRAPGYGRLGLRLDGRDQLDVGLEVGRTVTGRIRDASGKPVVQAYVAVMASERVDGRQQTDWVPAFTDAEGRFTHVSVRRDIPHCLYVRADGYGTLVYDFPANEAKRDKIDFDPITLPKAVYLTGRVLDEHGQPIAGTPVSLGGTTGDRYRFLARPPVSPPDKPRGNFYVNARQAMTDSLGRYHFADLAPGHYRVRARVEEVTPRVVGSSVVESKLAHVKPDGSKASVRHDFRIKLGRNIRGRVMTPSGRVPPQTQITVEAMGGDGDRKPLFLRSGLPFRLFNLPAGRLAITATPNTARGAPIDETKAAGTRTGVVPGKGITWVCICEQSWVQAFVLDKAGKPVAGVRVVATNAKGREVGRRSSDHRGSVALHVGRGNNVTLVAHPAGGWLGESTPGVRVSAGTSNVMIRIGR